jgi:hypothetical protein
MTELAAAVLLPITLAFVIWSFRGIIRRYRTLLGFPWLLSVAFAAAAVIAIFALHVLIDP